MTNTTVSLRKSLPVSLVKVDRSVDAVTRTLVATSPGLAANGPRGLAMLLERTRWAAQMR